MATLTPASPAHAQYAADTTAPVRRDTAILTLAGRRIVVLRAPLGAALPSERAAAAVLRFSAATERSIPESVLVQQTTAGMLLSLGGHPLFILTENDVDPSTGETLPLAATNAARRVESALTVVYETRSFPMLLRAALLSLLVTVAFYVALRLLGVGRRAIVDRLPDGHLATADVQVRGITLLRADQLVAAGHRAVSFAAWLIGLFFAYLWLTFVLTSFAYSRPWGEALGGYLRSTVKTLLLDVIHAVPGLFTIVIIVGATRYMARLVRGFFDAVEARTVSVPWVHPETANPTRRIAIAMLWMFAIVVSYPYLPGSGSDVFKGVSVFAGLVLSLGSSGVMNQAMSGLVLMYSRALRPGDYVLVGTTEGQVLELGMLSTKIRTLKGELVTVPNAVVASATVKNYTREQDTGGAVLLHTSVTIGYDTPWRQVHGLLLLAADRTEGLTGTPPAFVLQTALSDFYVEYQLNAALGDPRLRVPVLSALHANIVDAFNEYGVQITSPHYVLDPRQEKVVTPANYFAAPAERITWAPEPTVATRDDQDGAPRV